MDTACGTVDGNGILLLCGVFNDGEETEYCSADGFSSCRIDFLYAGSFRNPLGNCLRIFVSHTYVLEKRRQRSDGISPWYLFLSVSLPYLRCEITGYEMYLLFLSAAGADILLGLGKTFAGTLSFERKKSFGIFLILSVTAPAVLLYFSLNHISFLLSSLWASVLYVLYLLLTYLSYVVLKKEETESLLKQADEWQRESRTYMNVIRSQRHDFNIHLHTISGLVRSENYGKCGEYVDGLVKEAAEINDIMPVSDAVVGSMLYNMREQARQKGSEIYYEITNDLSDVICSGFTLNKIIGNLLQNAIDALESEEDKAHGVIVKISRRAGYSVIMVENRYHGNPEDIAKAFEPGYSTKEKHEGIGLSMTRRSVELSEGTIYPEFTEDTIRFIVRLPNKVSFGYEED